MDEIPRATTWDNATIISTGAEILPSTVPNGSRWKTHVERKYLFLSGPALQIAFRADFCPCSEAAVSF